MSARTKNYITVRNTAFLYPTVDFEEALRVTQQPYTFDGTNVVVPSMAVLQLLMYDIWYRTSLSQPVGNLGYTLGVGTYLEDRGKTIYFKFPNGETAFKWQLVKQLTPQVAGAIPNPGNSPNGTIGYIVVWASYPEFYDQELDDVRVVRVG